MLKAQNGPVPEVKQLTNAVLNAKRKLNGPPLLTTTDLHERLKADFVELTSETAAQDGDPAITAAVASSFPNAQRLTCYYHMKKQVQKRMGSKKVPKNRRNAILEEIKSLQLSCSDPIFSSAARRLLQRWKQLGLKTFARYFTKAWVQGPLRFRYEGAALGTVSTNNGLESLHGRIKRCGRRWRSDRS
uniref:MULE transposase domain-containing protein n=1 Tax=Plectus sambesii TaxID=2011161 RepID=A0A914XA05_9BILA